MEFVDGALARAMDTAAVPASELFSCRYPEPILLPRVLRVECMPLDCGGTAVVVELDRMPERTWMKSLKRALQADDVLEDAHAKFDGRFVYVVGVEGGAHRMQHRVVQALVAADAPRAPAGSLRSRAGGTALSSPMP